VIPFLFPGGSDTQVVPIRPLTRLTQVVDGFVIIRFATLKNFDRLEVRCTQSGKTIHPADAVRYCFFTFPSPCSNARDEVFAVAYFAQHGLYEVCFNFSIEGTTAASVPYFFNVTNGTGDTIPVIPAFWSFPPLGKSQGGGLEPDVGTVVTADQTCVVTVTVSPRQSVEVVFDGSAGQSALVARVKGRSEVKHRFSLTFPDVGSYTIHVYIDGTLAFKQQYEVLQGRIEENEQEESALQAEVAARIGELDEPRLLTDITDEVKQLVESWVDEVRQSHSVP
jgi:hypothetical protein